MSNTHAVVEMKTIRDEVRGMLDRAIKNGREVMLPEPDEENGQLTYDQGRDLGWDQGWYAGRREMALDILRLIEEIEAQERV